MELERTLVRMKILEREESPQYREQRLFEMQEIAVKRGGRCLSVKYVDALTKLNWECSKGHRWEATYSNISRGKWCPTCGGSKKLTIEDIHKVAIEKGGKCLSDKYVNARTNLTWECSKGHRWEATPDNIKRGGWCPTCGGTKKLTIEGAHKTLRGGSFEAEKRIKFLIDPRQAKMQ